MRGEWLRRSSDVSTVPAFNPIYYNSAILSKLRDKYEAEDNQAALGILKKISPVAWRHIHFQGHFKFSEVNAIDLEAIIEKLILSNTGKKRAEL